MAESLMDIIMREVPEVAQDPGFNAGYNQAKRLEPFYLTFCNDDLERLSRYYLKLYLVDAAHTNALGMAAFVMELVNKQKPEEAIA